MSTSRPRRTEPAKKTPVKPGGWKQVLPKVAEKLMDAGNLAFAGLLLSQLIGEKPFDVLLGAVGLSLWLILLAAGAFMMYLFPGE